PAPEAGGIATEPEPEVQIGVREANEEPALDHPARPKRADEGPEPVAKQRVGRGRSAVELRVEPGRAGCEAARRRSRGPGAGRTPARDRGARPHDPVPALVVRGGP